MEKKKKKKNGEEDGKLPNTFYFLLAIRFLAAICCVIILFCIGLSQYWTNRTSAIFGLLFTILSLLFVGTAISILFVWDFSSLSLVKKCLFTFVYTISCLIAAIMFLIVNKSCDPNIVTRFGCYENISSGTFQVAAAFSFIIFAFGIVDLCINLFVYWRETQIIDSRHQIYDLPPPSSTIADSTAPKSIHELFLEYHRKGQTTSV